MTKILALILGLEAQLCCAIPTALDSTAAPPRHTYSNYHKDNPATLCVSLAKLDLQSESTTPAKLRQFLDVCYFSLIPKA